MFFENTASDGHFEYRVANLITDQNQGIPALVHQMKFSAHAPERDLSKNVDIQKLFLCIFWISSSSDFVNARISFLIYKFLR
jgi:hypothetical protein